MRKFLSVILIASLGLVACGGRRAHPIAQVQPGDDYATCEQINIEIIDNNSNILKLIPKEDKLGKNLVLGTAGVFLLVPWIFMDFSDAERQEITAFKARNNWLRHLAAKKHCDLSKLPREIRFEDVHHHHDDRSVKF